MNGDTKNKLKGGFWGAIFTAGIAFIAFIYGYGVLNQRVEALEGKTMFIQEINTRLTKIEENVKWLRKDREGSRGER